MTRSTVTVPVAQFGQQLKQKYPHYAAMSDERLVSAFLSTNPRYTGNYEGATLVSVSFEPTAAAAPAQRPGVTSSIQPESPSPGTRTGSQAPVAGHARHTSASEPIEQEIPTGGMNAAEATVVRAAAPVSTAPSAAAAATEAALVPGSSPAEPLYLGSTVVVSAPAVAAPPMVGKYEIIDELGRGGMGIVYKAFDPAIGRTVALKLMSEQLARDTEFRSRFLREARGAGILQHPNIVTVHELGEWQGAPFIAMEFLQGRSLEDILKNEKTMPLEKRLDIVAQVCRGLDYAHARGIVHRDIKPANVMVTTDGVAKVVDFGIARLADQKLTNTGQILGTVSYMSPERLQGRTVDGRSDIFAAGVMLFEALTSVLPFAAEDTGSAITNILYRQPPGLSNFLANYPKELDEIVRKCLAKDPAERFQTAGELADSLTQAREQSRRSQTEPMVIRTTPLPAVPFDQPLGLPVTVTPQPESAPKPPERPSSRWTPSRLALVGPLSLVAIGITAYLTLRLVSQPQPSRESSVAKTTLGTGAATPQPSPEPAVPSTPKIAGEHEALKFVFAPIPAGEFEMGCSPGDAQCYDGEKPRHHVRITKGFEVGKYLVTQAMWESLMGNNPSGFKGAARPVETVSWNDVQQFLQRLNARNDGYRYRLPTEAEWEYAARAGSTSAHYGSADAISWYDGNSGRQTHPVGEKEPNAWRLYDMEGNAWEWVQDWYGGDYYEHSPDTDPQGPAAGRYRVMRGGSWHDSVSYGRVSNRDRTLPGGPSNIIGFRCVREVNEHALGRPRAIITVDDATGRQQRAERLAISGNQQLRQGNYAAALTMFREALQLDSTNSKAKQGLTRTQHAKDTEDEILDRRK